MSDYLLFQLYGPMASWGDIAVGEARITVNHPGRSALIGLLASALGIRREDEENQRLLTEGYRFAVRVLSAGSFLRDYHTAQVAGRADLKRYPVYTRRDELAPSKSELNTILSSRDYRCDAYYQIAVELVVDTVPWRLAELAEALNRPCFPLYLGRKSCPPALPVQAQVLRAGNLGQAFAKARFVDPDQLIGGLVSWRTGSLLSQTSSSLYWEEGMDAGIAVRETFTRRDQPRSRKRWQFDERAEHHAVLSTKE